MAVLTLALIASFAAGGINEGDVYVGSGQTASKTQAKLWFNDGAWWCILLDGGDHYIHRFQGDTAVKLDDGFVDSRNSAQADVLWTGEYLYALMGHRSEPRLYKFLYDPLLQSYSLVSGFPVNLSIGVGSLDATIAVDSTGQVWITYPENNSVRVIWSTSSDQTSWNQSGITLASGLESVDLGAIAAFDGKVGVMWSNQNDSEFGFRIHRDDQPDSQWDAKEIVSDASGIAEDHINLAVTPDQEVLAATKTKADEVQVWRRATSGSWSGPYRVAEPGTRPAVAYDQDNDEVYVLYTDLNGNRPIRFKHAPLSNLSAFASAPDEIFLGSDTYNDVTTTKQPLTTESGLTAAAKGGSYVSFRRIAFGTPLVDASASTYEGPAPLSVDFFGDGLADDDDSIDSYAWTFGDGSTSSHANPSHTYDAEGLYEATLTVTDGSGRTATASLHVNVTQATAPPPDSGGGGTEPPPPPLGEIVAAINFQPPGEATPADYIADTGGSFDTTAGFGWNGSVSMKVRGADPDPRLDTYAYVSNPDTATWEYVIPNGDYVVTVVAGSPQWTGLHYVSVEGTTVIDGVATDGGEFVTVDHPTTVSDGRLSVTIGGGTSKKTKICYLIIRADAGTAPPPAAPTASIGTDTTSGDAPLTVSFTGTGTTDSAIAGYAWDFGDGSGSTAQNPTHTFDAGTYTVTLTVTDDYGQTGTAATTITANGTTPTTPAAPTASIGADATSGEAPLTVSFTGTGTTTSSIVGYAWDFGDGGSSTAQNPTHTFDTGTFTVALTVTDDYGQTGTATTTIAVDAAPPPPSGGGGPVAQINFQPNGVTPPAGYIADTGDRYSSARGFGWANGPSAMQRDALADVRLDTYLYTSNGSPDTWEYDLPNGDYDIEVVMGSPLWNGIHYLVVEGTRCIDGEGTGSGEFIQVDQPVTVNDGKLSVTIGDTSDSRKSKICYLIIRTAGSTAPPPAPTANIGTDTTSGDAPLTVSFTGTGITDSSIAGYAWDFGDGGSSTAQNPTHTFDAGTYTVTLTVTDDYGQTGTATTAITASEPAPTAPAAPTASIGADTTSGGAPLTVSFTGTGTTTSSIVGYAWNFGDGSGSTAQNPTHTFDAGTYTVTLTVTDDWGQTGTATTTITVDAAPPPPSGSGELVAQINFQPAGVTPPAGYTAATDASYSSALGFGWLSGVGTKQRNALADVRLDTYVYSSNNGSGATWEYDLPNGDYEIQLVMGSPQWNGIHYLTVEGSRYLDGANTDPGEFVEVNEVVTVNDGKLSVTIGDTSDSKKSKICYLIIRRA